MESERERRRIEYALESVRKWATSKPTDFDWKCQLLKVIDMRIDRALRPRPDDAILQDWDAGETSEEWAYKELGVTRLEARAMLNDWRDRRAAAEPCAEGHEYAEVAPRREKCVRCGKVKEWNWEAE